MHLIQQKLKKPAFSKHMLDIYLHLHFLLYICTFFFFFRKIKSSHKSTIIFAGPCRQRKPLFVVEENPVVLSCVTVLVIHYFTFV